MHTEQIETNKIDRHRVTAGVISVGVGLVSFLVTEIMYYLLVPDIGRRWERLLAEGAAAVVVALLTAKLVRAANQRREAELLRMQIISEMNHHIRNALTAISLTAESGGSQEGVRVIAESVDRIEWTLREILLRDKPLPENKRDEMDFPARQALSDSQRGTGSKNLSAAATFREKSKSRLTAAGGSGPRNIHS